MSLPDFVGILAASSRIVAERQLSEKPALVAHVFHCGDCALTDLVSFKLSKNGQHLENHLARRRCGVDFLERLTKSAPALLSRSLILSVSRVDLASRLSE